jgi:hypothetical protein
VYHTSFAHISLYCIPDDAVMGTWLVKVATTKRVVAMAPGMVASPPIEGQMVPEIDKHGDPGISQFVPRLFPTCFSMSRDSSRHASACPEMFPAMLQHVPR